MSKPLLKARIGKSVFARADENSEWKETRFDSLSQAKSHHGLNSVCFKSPSQLPPKESA